MIISIVHVKDTWQVKGDDSKGMRENVRGRLMNADLEELHNSDGIQFDPELVRVFIERVFVKE